MNEETEELLKQIKAYRNDMVAKNYPFQQISDIITKWEMKKITEQISRKGMKDFLEEAEKEKKELNESYQESVRQAKERKVKTVSEELQDELEPIKDTSNDPFKGTSIEGKD
jgi:dissimilatory sulfite reductase (desulfoviridin) alpha/beta subunit